MVEVYLWRVFRYIEWRGFPLSTYIYITVWHLVQAIEKSMRELSEAGIFSVFIILDPLQKVLFVIDVHSAM